MNDRTISAASFYRRRAKRDLDDAKAESRTRVLKEMLPVVDNLGRRLAHTDGADAASLLEGVRLVLRQFTHAREKCEVSAIDADGIFLDTLHEVVPSLRDDEPGAIEAPGFPLLRRVIMDAPDPYPGCLRLRERCSGSATSWWLPGRSRPSS